jgi:glycosyltransferase involved in cell wall biosynthesis
VPTDPHVSVCIRAYDRPDGLAAAIESALAQTYGDLEVVVSDDSGRLEHVATRFQDTRVHDHPNPAPAGPAANLSRTVSLARGRLLAVLNDDDRWLPGFLAAAVDAFDRHPGIGVAFTDDYLEAGARRVRRRLPFTAGRHDHFLPELLAHSMPASSTVMLREAWEEGERTLPLSATFTGDTLRWLRAADAGWAFYYIGEPLGVSGVSARQVSWSDEKLPTREIASFDAFRFADPACETLRRARVAEFLMARAHVHVVRRRFRAAWSDIGRAHRVAPHPLGLRAGLALSGARPLAIRVGAARPWLLVPLLRLWRLVRPPVA